MIAALLAVLALQADAKTEAPLEWQKHLGAAVRHAAQRNTKLLVVFGSKTCPWCRKLEADTLAHPEFKGVLAGFALAKIDIDENEEAARALGVEGVPDLRLFTADGLPLAANAGYLPPEAFRAWLLGALAAKPSKELPSLRSVKAESALDPYFDLEAKGLRPEAGKLEGLLRLAGGPAGETRTEAQRLLGKWAPSMAPDLAKQLSHPALKIRLAAHDALAALGAGLEGWDPWAGPAPALPALETWLAARPPAPPVDASAWTPGLTTDLADVERGKSPAARERLIAAGAGLVPRLRERARSIRPASPAAAARLDEIRFRILLTPSVLRRAPDASERLAVGSAGERSRALEEVLRGDVRGLGGLVREAICDVDPLVRETGAAGLRSVLGPEAREPLTELLKDGEASVRSVALRELAGLPAEGVAEGIRAYLAGEKDAEMVASAVRALQEVKSEVSAQVLEGLLAHPHWSVRGAAVKALMEQRSTARLGAILGRLKDDDAFVVGQTLLALSKLESGLENVDVPGLVAELQGVLDRRPELSATVMKAFTIKTLRRSAAADALLRRATKHADPQVRAAALTALASDRERPAFDEVRAGLLDAAPEVRAAAAEGLRELVGTAELGKLLEKGQRPEAWADCRPALLEGLKHPAAEVRLQCSLTMLYFGDFEEAAPVWKALLRDGVEGIRKAAFDGFQWYGPEPALREAVFALWKEAAEADRDRILYTLGDPERSADPVEILLDLLPLPGVRERSAWSYALLSAAFDHPRNTGNDRTDEPKNAMLLSLRLKKAESRAAGAPERAVYRALALSYDPAKSIEACVELLSDPEPIVRRAALAVLLRAGEKVPAADLQRLAADPAPPVRALALVACLPPDLRGSFQDLRKDWLGGKILAWFKMSSSSSSRSRGGTLKPEVQLPEALLSARLADEDPEVRLRAAALTALEGSEDGVAYLHKAWRAEHPERETGDLLVGVLTAAWHDDYIPILEEYGKALLEEGRGSYRLDSLMEALRRLPGTRARALIQRLKTSGSEE